MSYSVKAISVFDRQSKRLIKKFPSLKKELQTLVKQLAENPTSGTSIVHDCYKVRISIASKGKGKSGGARVITHILFKDEIVFLLSIYDKSELDNLSDKEILDLLKLIP